MCRMGRRSVSSNLLPVLCPAAATLRELPGGEPRAVAWMNRKTAVLDQYLREQQNTQYGNCMLAKKPAHQTQSGECRRAH